MAYAKMEARERLCTIRIFHTKNCRKGADIRVERKNIAVVQYTSVTKLNGLDAIQRPQIKPKIAEM